jgi:hypothetical protein
VHDAAFIAIIITVIIIIIIILKNLIIPGTWLQKGLEIIGNV